MASLADELAAKGFLSANKLIQFLKIYHPTRYVSYPTMMRLIDRGFIKADRISNSYRIDAKEIERFVLHGNRSAHELADNNREGIKPSLHTSHLDRFADNDEDLTQIDFEQSSQN